MDFLRFELYTVLKILVKSTILNRLSFGEQTNLYLWWLLRFYDSAHIKDDDCRSDRVTPGGTAIPGMASLKDGDLQHSSALAQSPKGDIEPNPVA